MLEPGMFWPFGISFRKCGQPAAERTPTARRASESLIRPRAPLRGGCACAVAGDRSRSVCSPMSCCRILSQPWPLADGFVELSFWLRRDTDREALLPTMALTDASCLAGWPREWSWATLLLVAAKASRPWQRARDRCLCARRQPCTGFERRTEEESKRADCTLLTNKPFVTFLRTYPMLTPITDAPSLPVMKIVISAAVKVTKSDGDGVGRR